MQSYWVLLMLSPIFYKCYFLLNLSQVNIIWDEGPTSEKMPPSYWPIDMFAGAFPYLVKYECTTHSWKHKSWAGQPELFVKVTSKLSEAWKARHSAVLFYDLCLQVQTLTSLRDDYKVHNNKVNPPKLYLVTVFITAVEKLRQYPPKVDII